MARVRKEALETGKIFHENTGKRTEFFVLNGHDDIFAGIISGKDSGFSLYFLRNGYSCVSALYNGAVSCCYI